MAIRVENSAELDFGIMVSAVTASHIRCRRTADTADVILIDASDVAAGAGERLVIEVGDLDFVFPEGTTGVSRHLNRTMVDNLFANVAWQVDLLTDASTVVAVRGYQQQSHSAWRITEEADS